MGYESTEAIPLNVGGVPTYFITLKDDEGLVKNFSFVNINDYGIVGAGATIAEAKRNYSNKLTSKGNNVAFSDEAFGYTKEGIVTRITANIESGNSYYYMIIDDDMTKLFMASYMISEELPVTREGDKIKISYVDEANGTINVVEFDNLNLSQKISAEQQQKNEEATNIIQDDNNKIVEVDPEKNAEAWESLSEEERSKLLEMQEKEK